jgi:hypothetical protein
MPDTNVELSKNESELVTNSEFILTKNRIIEKVYLLFGLLSEDFKNKLLGYKTILPSEVFSPTPKIYKGENYLNLPYVMLDYPRVFQKEDVFAIRSFFWWGNYFSITLQLGGRFLQAYRNKIELNLENEMNADYFICINDAPWEHHFEESNYQSLKTIDSMETILNKPFIKIAKRHSLSEWNNAITFYESNYENLLRLLC